MEKLYFSLFNTLLCYIKPKRQAKPRLKLYACTTDVSAQENDCPPEERLNSYVTETNNRS